VGEVFADDLTALFRFTWEALKKIMGILDAFGEICGLKINREKNTHYDSRVGLGRGRAHRRDTGETGM
jgi:hypothetical protein